MNDNEGEASRRRAAIEDEAAAWHVRMDGEHAKDYYDAFNQWLAASTDHQKAYDDIAAAFEGSTILQRSQEFGPDRDDPQSKDVPAVAVRGGSSRGTWLGSRLIFAAAVAAAVIVVVGISGVPGPISHIFGDSDVAHATVPLIARHGEIRTARLADGSVVTLDTDSELDVTISNSERRAHLTRGRARFDIVRDSRPFMVEAGSGAITAHNAVFDIGFRTQHAVVIRLIKGTVDVSRAARHAVWFLSRQSLKPGQSIVYRTEQFKPAPISQEDALVDTSRWPSGWIECRSCSLSDLVEEANRYAAKPIILDDPAIGALQANGRYKVSDPVKFVERIARLFRLEVSQEADGTHLRPANSLSPH